MNTTFEKTRAGICLVLVIFFVTAGSVAFSDRTLLLAGDPAKGGSTHHAAPRDAMIAALASANPNPSMGDEAQTFDRLVGTWDAEFTFFRDDGTVFHKKGELLFGWIMDGRAIQDLWIGYPTENQKERTIGTTIRFFDTALKQWRVVFVNPQFNYVVSAQGGRERDRIVLHGLDADGLPIRWTFSEMKPDSRCRSDYWACKGDARPLSARNDVLVFQTSPLQADPEVTGRLIVKLWASSSAPDTDFTAKLTDVYPPSNDFPTGVDLNVADSIIRARYRTSREKSELMTPGQVYEFTIEMYPTSLVFKKGHRIRVDISSSNFPRFDVNPNTGEPLNRNRRWAVATNSIYHDPQHPSHIELPVIPATK